MPTAVWHDETARPAKVQAIAFMTLAGGILAILVSTGWAISMIGFCLPTTYYSLVLGIMAIVKANALTGRWAGEPIAATSDRNHADRQHHKRRCI